MEKVLNLQRVEWLRYTRFWTCHGQIKFNLNT